jgi:hypothetical protein
MKTRILVHRRLRQAKMGGNLENPSKKRNENAKDFEVVAES